MDRGVQILLLEDNTSLGLMFVEVLRNAGFEDVEHVRTAADAIEVLEDGKTDLCVFDIRLDPGTCEDAVVIANDMRLPVLLMSGANSMEDLTTVPDRYAFVAKPTPPKDLVTAIHSLLGGTA